MLPYAKNRSEYSVQVIRHSAQSNKKLSRDDSEIVTLKRYVSGGWPQNIQETCFRMPKTVVSVQCKMV
jgi:hypothetical protein